MRAFKQRFIFSQYNGKKTVILHQSFDNSGIINGQISLKCRQSVSRGQCGFNRPGKSGEIIFGLFQPLFPLLSIFAILDKLPLTTLIGLYPLPDMR